MYLDLSNKYLTTLDGIDLTGVTVLLCQNNRLTLLPSLPETVPGFTPPSTSDSTD